MTQTTVWAGADQGRHAMRPTQVASVPRTARLPIVLGFSAVLALLAGAWGGIAPYVGPVFGYSPDGTVAWHWALTPGVLALAPGALAVVVALVLISGGRRRPRAGVAGFLLAVVGAWFVIGPLAWRVLRHTGAYFVAAGPFRELTYQVGANLGPGLIVLASGAVALGWASHGSTGVPSTAAVAPAPPAADRTPQATPLPPQAAPPAMTTPPAPPSPTTASERSPTPTGASPSTPPPHADTAASAPDPAEAPAPPPGSGGTRVSPEASGLGETSGGTSGPGIPT